MSGDISLTAPTLSSSERNTAANSSAAAYPTSSPTCSTNSSKEYAKVSADCKPFRSLAVVIPAFSTAYCAQAKSVSVKEYSPSSSLEASSSIAFAFSWGFGEDEGGGGSGCVSFIGGSPPLFPKLL